MDLLEALTLQIREACDECIRQKTYGTDWDHIEKIERLPDQDGKPTFAVTEWHEMDEEDCHPTKIMSLYDLIRNLARNISDRAMNPAVVLFRDGTDYPSTPGTG